MWAGAIARSITYLYNLIKKNRPMRLLRASAPWVLTILALVAVAAAQQKKQDDFQRRTMELLTPEQKARIQATQKINRQEWIKEHPARESTGMIPLPELGKGAYQG